MGQYNVFFKSAARKLRPFPNEKEVARKIASGWQPVAYYGFHGRCFLRAPGNKPRALIEVPPSYVRVPIVEVKRGRN